MARGRPGYRRCAKMVHSDAALALKGVRQLKKLINVEYKSFQTVVDASPDTTGNVANLSAVAQGDDADDRDGNKIRPFSLQIKGNLIIHTSAVATTVRFMVVQDRSGTTTAPAITDMFASATVFAAGQPSLQTPQVNSRFKVISDNFYMLQDNGQQVRQVNIYRKLHGHTYYSGAAATDEGRNNYWLFTASNEATNVPLSSVRAVFKWIDN